MAPTTIHLLPNAHLDPVWLWDLREGLNEGISTVRTVLSLMEEYPQLTFIRGEALIYQHLEQYDPASFQRIRQHVQSGRWDVVGGVWVQPDDNLPATSTFHRHLARAAAYFRQRFEAPIRVGWIVDAFGHAGGLPDVYAAHGFRYFTCSRPQPAEKQIDSELFWWEGLGGARLLTFRPLTGWYGTEREEMSGKLDTILERSAKSPTRNIPCMMGLGNHGGGPTRRQIDDALAWAQKHPEVSVQFSTAHRYFAAVDAELKALPADALPVVKGELQYCLRGCYASSARTKYTYRQLEANLERAERMQSLAGGPEARMEEKLQRAEEALLLNTFHDILPGTSIRRATEEQVQQMGGALYDCRMAELDACNRIAAGLKPTVRRPQGDAPSAIAFVVTNPHETPFDGYMELEGNLDARPIWKYQQNPGAIPIEVTDAGGTPLPFQRLATENYSDMINAWRIRVLVRRQLPPRSSEILTLGYAEGAVVPPVSSQTTAPDPFSIVSDRARISGQIGERQLGVELAGQKLIHGLGAELFEDPYGSWGDWQEPVTSTYWPAPVERWAITQMKVLESGPLRAALWVRLAGKTSHLDLEFLLCQGMDAIRVRARAFISDRRKRLMLVMPCGLTAATFEVPGGSIRREGPGEMPGQRWVRTEGELPFCFASNALYSFNLEQSALRATIVRTCGYGEFEARQADTTPWRPLHDQGEHTFEFLLAKADAPIAQLATELEQPPVVQAVPVAGMR